MLTEGEHRAHRIAEHHARVRRRLAVRADQRVIHRHRLLGVVGDPDLALGHPAGRHVQQEGGLGAGGRQGDADRLVAMSSTIIGVFAVAGIAVQ